MSWTSPEFWVALMQIIGVNIVLSGDNAVVIALAARGLPPAQQSKAVAWGSGAAVVMRIVLTIVAVELLKLPFLKLVGAGLLLWIAVQLLSPEEEGGEESQGSSNMIAAIKTILIADLVMSLDNVIGVAAAAKGSIPLLIIGLAISIPLVIFASTLLLTLMTRWPVIITLGAALLGWVAGEMAVTDPAIAAWINLNMAYLHVVAPAAAAVAVVLFGRWWGQRAHAPAAIELPSAPSPTAAAAARGLRRIVLAIDGSAGSEHAVRQLLSLRGDLRDPAAIELHLINVQPSLPGDVSSAVGGKTREQYHHELSDAAMKSACASLDAAGQAYQVHRQVGDPGAALAALADMLRADLIVMGTRGMGARAGALLGSVAQRTLELSRVPVLVVK